MKVCNQIQDLFSLFLEGETSPEETRRITEHLASCQECKKALTELKKTVDLVKNLDEVEPPPFFTQRIMAHVREEAEKSTLSRLPSPVSRLLSKLFYPLHIKIPVQAFGLVIVVGLVLLVYRSIEPEIKLSSAPTETSAPVLKDEAGETSKKVVPAIEAPRKQVPLKGQIDAVKPARKEEAATPTAPTREKVVEKKSEVPAERPSQEPAVAFAPAPKESPQFQKAPAAPSPAVEARQAGGAKETESLGVAGGAARDRMDRAAAPPARESKAAAKGFERLEFVLRAADAGSAANEVETLLNRLGAREIAREPREPGAAITGVIENRKLSDLVDKLRLIGEMRTAPAYPGTSQGESRVLIRIEP